MKDYDDLTLSIFLSLTSKVPLLEGIKLANRKKLDMWNISQNELIQLWYDSMPDFIKGSVDSFMSALKKAVDHKEIDMNRVNGVAGFVLGDLSKKYNTNRSGLFDWRNFLPAYLISLFNAIPINWKQQTKVLIKWLRVSHL